MPNSVTGLPAADALSSTPVGSRNAKWLTMDISKYDRNMAVREADADGLAWYRPDEKPFTLAGFHWFNREGVYRRLPLAPESGLPEAVDALAWCTAGGQVKFRTDSGKIAVKATLRDSGVSDHMAQTGTSGFDLYTGEPGRETFHAVTRFPSGLAEFNCELLNCKPGTMRAFTLNFPLYKGVHEVRIGLGEGAAVATPPAYTSNKPIVVYGSSITQGGCASRPGSCYTNILARHLNMPFINLGFSGSGRGEAEVARTIATIDSPALIVLDYEANGGGFEGMEQSLPRFISILRDAYACVPILVISKIRCGQEALARAAGEYWSWQTSRELCRAYQRNMVRRRRKAGDGNIHFLDGAALLGKDYWEGTVDGIHPTDLGFARMAAGIEAALRRILAIPRCSRAGAGVGDNPRQRQMARNV